MKKDGDEEHRTSQADTIVSLVWDNDVILFRDAFGEPFARFKIEGHWETHRLRSKLFRRWLCLLLWQEERKAPNANALSAALAVLEGKACFEGPKAILHNRVAWDEEKNAIWYDLTNANWEAVKITEEGWEVVKYPPILFQRYAHMQPQVTPVHNGDVRQLHPFLNFTDPKHAELYLVYLISCLVPGIPHVVAVFHGQQGAAKTTSAKMTRCLIDPSSMGTLSFPTASTDLTQQLSHHWYAPFDNVTYLPDWASDALCRAVTGGGFGKRELYSDDDDVIYSFQRCIGINGINLAAQKSDLLDRCLILQLERIPDDQRMSEKEVWGAFEKARPVILGGMFDALSAAMRLQKSIHLTKTPRMADFAHWGTAIAQALGSTKEVFLAVYFENINRQHEEVICADMVAAALVAFMEKQREWEGNASGLLSALQETAMSENIDTHGKRWPKAPNSLSRRLNEVRTNLAEMGITVDLLRDANGKRRIHIVRTRGDTDGTDAISGASSLPDL